MKKVYEKLILNVEFFEEQDVVTMSFTDGMAPIPEDWWTQG